VVIESKGCRTERRAIGGSGAQERSSVGS
jgi:hypothetical protein